LLSINKTFGNELIESFLSGTLLFLTKLLVTFFSAKGNQTLANLFAQLIETQSPFTCDRTNSLHPTDVTWIYSGFQVYEGHPPIDLSPP
jgi:hypothetical protein